MAKRNKALTKLKKAEARAVEHLALARAKAARKIAKVKAALAGGRTEGSDASREGARQDGSDWKG